MTGLSRAQQLSKVLIDVWDGWNGLHLTGNSPNNNFWDFRTAVLPGTSVQQTLFPSAGGAIGALQFDAAIGRVIHQWASGAAAVHQSTQAGATFGFPFAKRFSLPDSPPVEFLPPLRRFRVDFLPRITVVGTAEVLCGAGYDPLLALGANNPFIAWSSRPAVNAGRWMPRYRLVAAGPIIDGPDSGLSAAAFRQLSIVYEEGAVPRIEWRANGQSVFALAGDANMPTAIGGAFALPMAKVVGLPAGTTTQWCESRFRVEEM